MKQVPSTSAKAAVKRSKSLSPKFGPEPVPQPVAGRFALPMRPAGVRRKPASSWRPRKSPWAFVFIRRSKLTPAAETPELKPPARRKVPVKPAIALKPAAVPEIVVPPTPPVPAPAVRVKPEAAIQQATRESSPVPAAVRPIAVPAPAPARRREVSVSLPSVPPVPRILLEGDFPVAMAGMAGSAKSAPVVTDVVLGHKSKAPAPARQAVVPEFSKVPESPRIPAPAPLATPPPPRAGVWLSARDSHCLLIGWSADRAWLRSYADAFPGGSWEWRLRSVSATGPVVLAGRLPADCDFQFVTVVAAGASYLGEVGFRYADGGWMSIGVSLPVLAPPDAVVKSHDVHPEKSGAPAFAQPQFRSVAPVASGRATWTGTSQYQRRPEQSHVWSVGGEAYFPQVQHHGAPAMISDEVFEEILWGQTTGRLAGGSSEALVTETVTTRNVIRVSRPGVPTDSEAGIAEGQPSSAELVPSAPAPAHDFWFKVNAELVIHGSTEPDAKVSIAGRPVPLRPDGSFTFRFSLPDGQFVLPVLAISARGDDGRSAELSFGRHTEVTGLVGVHPVDSSLRPPVPETIG